MSDHTAFLSDLRPRSWSPLEGYQLQQGGLFLGHGTLALEVTVAHAMRKLSNGDIRKVWKDRKGGRACPLIFVILHSGKATLCGASGEEPPIYHDLNIGQVERLCKELLDQPDRHDALSLLSHTLSSFRTSLPGIKNEGLLALHELEKGVPLRSDRKEAHRKAQTTVGLQGKDLLEALGFSVERLDSLTSVLRSNDHRTALAVMLQEQESIEFTGGRFDHDSPVNYAFRRADKEGLKWIIFTQGNRIRLYANDLNVGVGRRGRTETYIECQPWLLSDDHLHYLWLLYSAEALTDGGSLHQLLEDSTRYAGDLAKRLRERIYEHVIPVLAKGIAEARGITNPDVEELAVTYEMALTVLFRLLFIAYAEDRNLLPYEHNDAYFRRSLTIKAIELTDAEIENVPIAEGFTHWRETVDLFEAVAKGNIEWGVPAYGGALFSDNEAISKVGAELSKITLPNQCFETVLRDLLVSRTAEGYGNVDFRSLGVREFGTIYEGLLESGLAMAEMDLVLKKHKNNEVYVPAKDGETAVIQAGEVYLHNRSGARKSSGSYYTKSFIVDHLLEGALKPALKDHLERLDAMDDADAGEAFFDFRVADIAMGSGHFLISSIDLMEQMMGDYVFSKRQLPRVMNELTQLRSIAMETMSEVSGSEPIENSQLLRRLIARRCIYGVDINPLAVQLARLAVWIHTFVPGLPLSFLDRTLIQGNALVGMGTIAEIRDAFQKTSAPLFNLDPQKLLGKAEKPLRRLANSNDSTLKDIEEARTAQDDVRASLQSTKTLCDLLTSAPIVDDSSITEVLDEWEEFSDSLDVSNPKVHQALNASRDALEPLTAIHFPIAFPEVFLRDRAGFDVILGNPPWENVKVEEDAFWARHYPGLRGKSQREQEAEKAHLRNARPDLVKLYELEVQDTNQFRKALMSGDYPGIGTGDPDLYKAFCWRFWKILCRNGGQLGVVLPRSAFATKGTSEFRRVMFSESKKAEVVALKNRRGWIFDTVTPQYTIALLCASHGKPNEKSISLKGPYYSLNDFMGSTTPVTFTFDEIKTWNDTVTLPLLPSSDSVEVFAQLRKSPRLDMKAMGLWRARPDRELDSANNKFLMDLVNQECPDGFWPVYKGASFDLWTPDTGIYYAWADPEKVFDFLFTKRKRGGKNRRSVHSEFSEEHRLNPETLPCHQPRIAFRDVARSTDKRTVVVALVPPNVFITDAGPYFLWPQGDEKDQAFLLGVLASIPLDWYARRFVETHLTYFVINPFPVPHPTRDNPLWKRVVELSGRLACPDERFSDWAGKVGVKYGPLEESNKKAHIHELDAVVAHLYGLTEPQLIHIFETFRDGWNYEDRLFGVLHHYKNWNGRL